MANDNSFGRTIDFATETVTATAAGTAVTGFGPDEGLIATLNVTAAVHTTNETYDIYLTTSDGVSEWDIAHFPQVATAISATPKTYTARISTDIVPQVVTTASPGVAAVDPGCLETDTAGSAQGAETLAAGSVRHGLHADRINWRCVLAGTDASPSITFSIVLTAVPR